MLEGYLDSWGSSSEERAEQHRAVSRCMRVLALLAGGGTAEMMLISHSIKFLRGTFSMNALLSSRWERPNFEDVPEHLQESTKGALTLDFEQMSALFYKFSWRKTVLWSIKCLLGRRYSQEFLERPIPLIHPVSKRNNRVRRLDMNYLEFGLGVGQRIR